MLTLAYFAFSWLFYALSIVSISFFLAEAHQPALEPWLQKLLFATTALFSGGALAVEVVHRLKPMYTGFAFLYTGLIYIIGVGLALLVSKPLEPSYQNTAISILGVFLLVQIFSQTWYIVKKLKNK